MPVGHVVLKIYMPCKNFYVPSQYLYKPCKAYVYCWENKYMPRLKNHLPSWAHNHKSLGALGQDLCAPGMRARLNVEPCGGGHKKIKGSAHMVEGGHYLRKVPNPHPQRKWSKRPTYRGFHQRSCKDLVHMWCLSGSCILWCHHRSTFAARQRTNVSSKTDTFQSHDLPNWNQGPVGWDIAKFTDPRTFADKIWPPICVRISAKSHQNLSLVQQNPKVSVASVNAYTLYLQTICPISRHPSGWNPCTSQKLWVATPPLKLGQHGQGLCGSKF